MTQTNDVNTDLQYLKLLSIFHYVVGRMMYLAWCFLLFPVILQIVMFFMHTDKNRGYIVSINYIGCFVLFLCIAAGLALATLVVITGRKLAKLKSHMFCMVIAGIECIFMPFGTVLGVFTIVLPSRPSVKALFDAAPTVISEQHV